MIETGTLMKRTAGYVTCLLAAGSLSCSDGTSPSSHAPEGGGEVAPPGMAVSNARSATASRVVVSGGAALAENVAYVSAAPGTFPGAVSAKLRNQTRNSGWVAIPVNDGGFDPSSIGADAGDELSLEVTIGSGPTIVSVKVPVRLPPRVVRTNPAQGRSDVALNVQVLIVFSEPVDKSTVTTSSVVLLRNGIPVSGTVNVSEDGLNAFFVPQSSLEPSTAYALESRPGIRDLDGDPLGEGLSETFTTASEGTVDPLGSFELAFVSTRDGKPHIYLARPDGTGIRRLTDAAEPEYTPAWSPDGARLAFNRDDGTYLINKNGGGLIRLPNGGSWPAWSPDGKRLVVVTPGGLRIVAADGSDEPPREFQIASNGATASISDIYSPSWSPDGTQIAFAAWLNGADFIRSFVINFDGTEGRMFVKGNGVIWDECGPVWSPNGRSVALLGGVLGPGNSLGVAVVDPSTGIHKPIVSTGTTCWDGFYGFQQTMGGVAWSPDGSTLAITTRTPPWIQGLPTPPNQHPSIAIVNVDTRDVQVLIPNAYDPAWARGN
jgi:Tol biopolymer transport system component